MEGEIHLAERKEIYQSFIKEVESLKKEFNEFIKMKDFIYPDEYMKYSERFNTILNKYYKSTGIPIEKIELYEFDYSSTKKTIKETALMRYDNKLNTVLELVKLRYYEEKEKEEQLSCKIKSYEMRKCLKTNTLGCPRNPELKKGQVFVGMPFSSEYYNDYEYGIKIALENMLGKKIFRADSVIENIDIMCKICYEMQTSESLIFVISGSNPNVMFELGLSYGLGKETILLKKSDTKPISDLSNVEYIEYRHAKDIQDKLFSYFNK